MDNLAKFRNLKLVPLFHAKKYKRGLKWNRGVMSLLGGKID